MNLGQIAFEAYNEAAGGLTYDGKPIPAWADIGENIQHRWEAAAEAAVAAVHAPLQEKLREGFSLLSWDNQHIFIYEHSFSAELNDDSGHTFLCSGDTLAAAVKNLSEVVAE